MNLQAQAFWISQPGRGELRTETLEPPGTDEVLVRTLYSGISRGTESLVFAGQVPASEYQRMRCPFQAGDFPGPLKYGYASVGRVEQGPAELLGKTVFCLYPHQDRYRVPAASVTVLPAGLPAERAVLAANMETALNACWDAAILPGDRVSVIGAGVVGALTAWLAARIPGTEVCLVDRQPQRETLARQLGCDFALPDQVPADCDVVVHASASESGLATALAAAGLEARVIELSWYGDQTPRVPLGQAFHARRLALISSQVGRLAAHRQARWDFGRRLRTALTLLRDPALDHLINAQCHFDELPEAMTQLAAGPSTVLCQRVVYDSQEND